MQLIYFFQSFVFFASGLFVKRNFDVVFYYPHHFNRGKKNENQFFKKLLQTCDKQNISYVVFEEPDYSSVAKRNKNAIGFDFVYVLIILLRKLFNTEMCIHTKDQKIGRFLSKVLFRSFTFKHFITLSQSMLSVFRGLNPNANLFDLQHGIIHNNKENYLMHGLVAENLKANNASLLLQGKSYKELLVKNEIADYFQTHTHVIGSHVSLANFKHQQFNNNVLITLQFTHDHSKEENKALKVELTSFIRSFNTDINFYLKHHPRFNNEVDLSSLLALDNVHLAPEDIHVCFDLCSLHATAYSTCTFEAALLGIPTVLINPLSAHNYFVTDFSYPINHTILDFSEEEVYSSSSKEISKWATAYYEPFIVTEFLKIIQ
jgi:hypothetical protein